MSKAMQNFLMLVAGIGATVIFIVFAWAGIQSYQSNAQKQMDKGATVMAEIDNEEFNRYQDTSVSGSEVLNLIKRYDGSNTGIIVTIASGGTSTSTCYCKGLSCANGVASYNDSTSLGTIADAKDVTKTSKYINPTKKFTGEVLKDAAGNIVGLHFTLSDN